MVPQPLAGANLDRNGLDGLQAGLRGELLLPGNAAYDEARSVWNAMIDRRPAAIARCLGTADVMTCVNFAREHGLPLSIKGGGHNIAGLAVSEGGLMLDMSLRRGVWVDPAASVAWAQTGCLLGDLDRETQLHGLAAPLGLVSNTGIAGLTLGGGFGYLTRRFGWTVDNVNAMEVVTAEGRLVRASEKENADLFWGLRGGGGNFGVVTGIEYRLFPIGPEVMAGVIAWRAADAGEVLELYRAITEEAPAELTCGLLMRPAPAAPWLPREIHGQPIVAIFVCDTGPLAEAEKRAAQIKGFGSPVGDVIQKRSYLSQQSIFDATQPKGRRYYWKFVYLPGLDPALPEKIREHGRRIGSPYSAILLMPVDGALRRRPDDYNAMGNRDAVFELNIMASWENPADDAANIGWARAAWEDIRTLSTGGTHVNFLTEDEGDERTRAAYGANYERLVAVKTAWDPANLFHINKNIAPRRTA
ncbi:MAG TPA: FAD-binding oxidoreductase [Anaerolineae bacterium]